MVERRVAVEVDANVSPFIRSLSSAGAAAKGFTRELESADSRMANLVQTGLALAPALVPIGAAAVPAVAGLTEQLGFAVLATGTAVLAFNGLGDALDALDKYKLDPTTANFEKLQQTMDKLGPAGQEFALFIDRLEPKMRGFQAVAEAGLFPGVESGIRDLLTLLPEAKRSVFAISSTLGSLVADVGNHADDARWQKFFQFIDTEATPTLTAMGKTLGNVVSGFTSLVMAFDPVAQDFTHGMLNMSRSFAAWADGLGQTRGFQDFVAYVRAEGPQVVQTLGALGNALVQIVEAAAPVGSVSLRILKDLADVLASVADSPAGPVLISAAAAVGVLGRSLALLKTVGLRGGGDGFIAKTITQPGKSAIATMREMTAATKELTAAQASTARERGLFAVNPSRVGFYTEALKREAEATERVIRAEGERNVAVRRGMAAAGKAAGVVAGLAFATSGLADKTGLSNTASLALMGTIAGPWGAAIGGGVGAVMDLASANNDLSSAISHVNEVAKQTPIDLGAQQSALLHLQQAAGFYQASINHARDVTSTSGLTLSGTVQQLKDGVTNISDLFTHSSEEADAAIAHQAKSLGDLKTGLIDLQATLNGKAPVWAEPSTVEGIKAQNDELSKFASEVAPAAAMAGLNLRHILITHDGWDQLVGAIRNYNASMDSATGKSKAVGAAMADLGSLLQSDASQADALKSAMDALFGVQLSQSAATDAWISSLRDLHQAMRDAHGDILSNSKAALAARASTRAYVQSMEDKAVADAAANVSGQKIAETLLKTRQHIVETAKAAGATGKDIRKLVHDMGLTPKNLRTIIETPGLLTAKQRVEALGRLYNLTPKEVKTLLKAQDDATPDTKALKAIYDKLDHREIVSLLKALDEATPVIRRINAEKLYDKTLRIRTEHYDFYSGSSRPNLSGPGRAFGGPISGYSPSPTADNIHIMATAGEFMQPVASVDYYGLGAMEALRQRRIPKDVLAGYAGGGQIERARYVPPQRLANGGRVTSTVAMDIDYDRLARALAAVRPVYGDVHMQPHNYSEFERQMLMDHRAAALDGTRGVQR